MAQKVSHTERTEIPPSSNLIPTEFVETGKKRVEEFVNTQTELLEKLQEMNGQWFNRAQSEANLASELCLQIDGSAFHPRRDDGIPGVDQPAV